MLNEEKTYESVEISDSEFEEAEQQGEESTESKSDDLKDEPDEKEAKKADESGESEDESDEGGDQNDENNEDEPVKVMVGDQEFTVDEINEALESHKNKTDWSKSNTMKAQEVADQRKSLEPMVQLLEKLKGNNDLTELLADSIEDEFGEEGKDLFAKALESNPEFNPYKTELEEAQQGLADLQAEIALNQAKADLKSQYKLKDSDVEKVVDHAVKTMEDTGRVMSLEEAYKVMNYDELKEKAEKKNKPKPPKLAKKGRGAADIKSKKKDGELMNYDDVDISEFITM